MRSLLVVASLVAVAGCRSGDTPLRTHVPRPQLEAVTPDRGASTGGTAVELSGEDFHPLARVWFGQAAALSVVVADDGARVTCTTPPGADTVHVRVANPGGLQAELEGAFSYVPGPAIEALDPAVGPESGDVMVRVTASGLQPGEGFSAWLGGRGLTPTDVSADGFSFLTPPGRGRATLFVENPDGQSDVRPEAFSYVAPPRVRSVRPAVGTEAGGTEVMLIGAAFRPGATVTFGGSLATGVEVLGDARIRALTPPGTGAVPVTVHDPEFDQAIPLEEAFLYLPTPVVESVEPASGPERGGTRVRVVGQGFVRGRTQVRFGAESGVDTTYPADGEIETSAPPGTGIVDVVAAHEGIASEPLVGAFAYVPPPVVARVEPDFGPTAGGATVEVVGEALLEGARVWFGANEAPEVVVDAADRLVATTPPGPTGRVEVVVRNPDGQEGRLAGAYSYVPPPLVAGAQPADGCVSGGYPVALSGRDLRPGLSVWFGDEPAEVVEFVSPDTVLVRAPPGAGSVDVRVANPDGQEHTLEDGFGYDALPRPAAVVPRHGPLGGGTDVRITGTCLADVQAVRLGGAALVPLMLGDDEAITGRTPAAAEEGRAELEVEGPGGELARLPAAFSYHDGSLNRAGALRGDGPAATSAVAAVDLDADGLPELVVAHEPMDGLASVPDAVYRNSGGGGFDLLVALGPADRVSKGVAAADLDGDRRIDLVFAVAPKSAQQPDSGVNVVYRNLGGLELEPVPGALGDRSESTLAVALPDIDSDGDPDVVFAGLSGARLYLNEGEMDLSVADGRLGAAGQSGLFVALTAADLDGVDGPDLLLASLTAGVRLLANDGRGFFSDVTDARLPVANPDAALALAAGDLDGDGDLDVIVGLDGPDRLWLQEDGVFVDATLGRLPELDAATLALALGDLDGDGAPEIVCGLGGAHAVRNTVYLNDGDGAFADATAARLPNGPVDRTQALALADLDGDGVLDLFVANAGTDRIHLD